MPKVELRKPTTSENTWHYDTKVKHYVGEKFNRGERIVMVDGVRWGRTIVTMHGCNGTRHVFKQDHGGVICDVTKSGSAIDIAVRSQKRRKWLGDKDDWQPTETKVLAKAIELVQAGRLRDPNVVRRELSESNRRYVEHLAKKERQRVDDFRAKAIEALQINDPESDDPRIERVVAAMEWARSK